MPPVVDWKVAAKGTSMSYLPEPVNVLLFGKRDLTAAIKLKILTWGHYELLGGPQTKDMGP